MDFFHFSAHQWLLALLAAYTVGLAKSGFSGVGMLIMVLMANAMRGYEKESTGVVLPLLICGDLFASQAFRQHVRWPLLGRMLLPAAVGVVLGYFWMRGMSNAGFKPLIGWIVLGLTLLHYLRQVWPAPFAAVPHSAWFVWTMGVGAGVTTMLANAAGPVVALFFLAVALPKMEFVGTSAFFFLCVNLFKVPFSFDMGFINGPSLLFNLALVPAVALGIWSGRGLVHRMNQWWFEQIVLVLTLLTALHLIFA